MMITMMMMVVTTMVTTKIMVMMDMERRIPRGVMMVKGTRIIVMYVYTLPPYPPTSLCQTIHCVCVCGWVLMSVTCAAA